MKLDLSYVLECINYQLRIRDPRDCFLNERDHPRLVSIVAGIIEAINKQQETVNDS